MKYSFRNNELNAIIELIKCKNYGIAAKNLNIAQANLSRTITSIEERIGLKIFERDTRPIKTTKFGDALVPLIEKNLEAIDEIVSFTESFKESLSERINICAPTGILFFLSKNVLHEVKKIRPELNIQLTTFNTGDSVYKNGIIVSEDADITFTYSSPTNESLVVKKLTSMKLNIYSTRKNSLAHPVKALKDLEKYPAVLLSEAGVKSNQWFFCNDKEDEQVIINVSGNFIVDNYMTAVEVAKNNDCYLLAPELLIEEMQPTSLMPICISPYQAYGNIYMVFKQKSYLPYRIQVVTQLIEKIIGDMLPS